MGWRVALNDRAALDLEQTVAFLAQKNPAAAERVGLNLVATIFSLTELPHRGLPMRGRTGYRRIHHRPWWVIFYRVDESQHQIEIVRIWDARQDPTRLKFD